MGGGYFNTHGKASNAEAFADEQAVQQYSSTAVRYHPCLLAYCSTRYRRHIIMAVQQYSTVPSLTYWRTQSAPPGTAGTDHTGVGGGIFSKEP